MLRAPTAPQQHPGGRLGSGLNAHLSCFALRPGALRQREASEGDPERCSNALQVWMVADYDGYLASQLACMHAVPVIRRSRVLDASTCAT